MNKALLWVIVAVAVVLLLVFLAVLPVRRGAEEVEFQPGATLTPVSTLLPTAPPSPEVLTPEKEKLADLEAETESLESFDQTLDADVQDLDTQLRGI